jgi:ubiquitin carboxyl-terminal hydrolase 9/24
MESLESFTEVEVLKEDNAYFCEQCNSKQTAEKCIKFKDLPTVLNIQLKRFEYDWENNQRVKLNDEISFPSILVSIA